MKKWILVLVLGLMAVSPAYADTLTAKLNRNPVPLGETFVLNLEYDGDPGSNRPDFSALEKDFTVYMVSNSYKGTYSGGRMKKTYIWSVSMAADKIGTYTIPALSVGSVKSRPVELKVVNAADLPAGERNRGTAPSFAVSRTISNPDPLVQQQVNYSFKIRTTAALQGTTPQFMVENGDDWIIRGLGDPVISSNIKDGVEEREITFNYALFPQKSGSLVIPEVRFNGYYIDPNARGNSSMQRLLGAFGGLNDAGFGLDMLGSRVPVALKAPPISIEVGKIPAENNGNWWLPAKKAELYSDWQEKMPSFKSGEAVNREIYLRVTGVIDTQLPSITFPEIDGVKQYPEKPVVKSDVDGEDVVSVMKINTVYIPEKSGKLTIPEIVVNWYDVTAKKMKKAVLPAVSVNVAQGSAPVVRESAAPVPAVAAEPATGNDSPDKEPAGVSLSSLAGYLVLAFIGGIAVSLLISYLLFRRLLAGRKETPAPAPAETPVSVAKAVRSNDLKAIRDNVLAWARKTFPDEEVRNLDDVGNLVGSREFSASLKELQSALYAGKEEVFNAAAFMEIFSQIGKHVKRSKKQEQLLPRLYK